MCASQQAAWAGGRAVSGDTYCLGDGDRGEAGSGIATREGDARQDRCGAGPGAGWDIWWWPIMLWLRLQSES